MHPPPRPSRARFLDRFFDYWGGWLLGMGKAHVAKRYGCSSMRTNNTVCTTLTARSVLLFSLKDNGCWVRPCVEGEALGFLAADAFSPFGALWLIGLFNRPVRLHICSMDFQPLIRTDIKTPWPSLPYQHMRAGIPRHAFLLGGNNRSFHPSRRHVLA